MKNDNNHFFLNLEIKSMAHLGNENLNNEAQILIFSFYFSIYEMTNLISHCFLTILFEESKTLSFNVFKHVVCAWVLVCMLMHACVRACIHALRGQRGMSSIFLNLFSTLFIMVGSLREPRAGCWLNYLASKLSPSLPSRWRDYRQMIVGRGCNACLWHGFKRTKFRSFCFHLSVLYF